MGLEGADGIPPLCIGNRTIEERRAGAAELQASPEFTRIGRGDGLVSCNATACLGHWIARLSPVLLLLSRPYQLELERTINTEVLQAVKDREVVVLGILGVLGPLTR